MCLIIGKEDKPLIAEEDVIAYKILCPNGDNHADSAYWYRNGRFMYELGKLYQTTIEETKENRCFDDLDSETIKKTYGDDWKDTKALGQGFHGALKLERTQETLEDGLWSNNKTIYQVTIPKGAEYYVNCSGLFVSNKIIINKKL